MSKLVFKNTSVLLALGTKQARLISCVAVCISFVVLMHTIDYSIKAECAILDTIEKTSNPYHKSVCTPTVHCALIKAIYMISNDVTVMLTVAPMGLQKGYEIILTCIDHGSSKLQ